MLLSVPCHAVTDEYSGAASLDGNVRWSIYKDTVTFSGVGTLDRTDWQAPHLEAIGRVVISEGITGIAENYFSRFSALKSVTVAASVTDARGAFANCPALTMATFADGTQKIPAGILALTPALRRVDIPDSVSYISFAAFEQSGIGSIKLPDAVTHIDSAAFTDCESLKSVNFPKSLTFIGASAFEGTALEKIVIPEGVTEIWTEAFRGCDSLSSVSLPDSLETIAGDAFDMTPVYDNGSVHGAVYVDNCLINGTMFSGRLTVADGTRIIANEAFVANDSITDLVIPSSVKAIGDKAFSLCRSLENITINGAPDYIGRDAFSLTAYYSDKANWTNGALYIGRSLITVHKDISKHDVLDGTVTVASGACLESGADITLPGSVKNIGYDAFWFTEFSSIVIPEGVERIGKNAFNGSDVTTVTLPATLKAAGYGLFESCDELRSVYFTGNEAQWAALGIQLPEGAQLIYGTPSAPSPAPETKPAPTPETETETETEADTPTILPETEVDAAPDSTQADTEIDTEADIGIQPTPDYGFDDTDYELETETETEKDAEQDTQGSPKKPSLVWMAVVVAIAVLAAGGAVFLIAYKRHKRHDDDAETFTPDEQ